MTKSVKRHMPKSSLAEKAARPGGVTVDRAVAAAMENLEELRDESEQVLLDAVAALEALVAGTPRGALSEHAFAEVEAAGSRILSLAGMFEMPALLRAARSLCDLIARLSEIANHDVSGIVVHVQAMRLFAPHADPLATEEKAKVFEGLTRVLEHYRKTTAV
jgi:hypothetical protein